MAMWRPSLFLCLAGVVMAQPADAAEQSPTQPVWMDVTREGNQLVIAVLAASKQPISVTVELDVQGGSKLHTVNRAQLTPDRPPVVLSRAAIDARHPWTARLSVTPEGGDRYMIERNDRD